MTPASAATERGATSDATVASRTGAAADGGTNAEGSLAVVAESSATLVDAPGASCAGTCAKNWNSCKQQCKAGPCRSGCDEHYRGCMRGCF
jgi:hypothetical protein